MSFELLNAVAVRAQAPRVSWDELAFVLRLVSHGYVRWAQRGAEVGRPVAGAVERLRRARGGR